MTASPGDSCQRAQTRNHTLTALFWKTQPKAEQCSVDGRFQSVWGQPAEGEATSSSSEGAVASSYSQSYHLHLTVQILPWPQQAPFLHGLAGGLKLKWPIRVLRQRITLLQQKKSPSSRADVHRCARAQMLAAL